MRVLRIAVYAFCILTLAACGGGNGDSGTPQPSSTPQVSSPVINWDKSPTTVVIRLDRTVPKEPAYDAHNRIPPCTLYGDGHLVWVNNISGQGEEVLEAYLDEVTMRGFLEFIIRDQKFYDVPDYASQELPPTETTAVTSITLNVNSNMRTIRSFRPWPSDIFSIINDRCLKVSSSRAVVDPPAAWVTVFEQPRNQGPYSVWKVTMPFKAAQAAASNTTQWVTRPALTELWQLTRRFFGNIQWIEGTKAYRVAIQVPGISRDSPPAPPPTPTPVPPTPQPTTPGGEG